MKKFIFFVFIVSCLIASCDKIEPPFLSDNNETDTTLCPVPTFPAFSNPQKKVLLEEFTGHKCPNCPSGAATIHTLLEDYPNKLFAVAIHAGFFATADASGDFTANYIIPEGEELATYFNVIFNPIGMVNRKKFNNEFLVNPGDWNTAISNIISESPKMHLQIINEMRPQDSSYCIHTKVNFLENMQGNFNLCVIITEDSVASPQKTNDAVNYPSGVITDYKHQHVFRKSLSSTWGKNIASGNVYADSSYVQTYRLILNPAWHPEHLDVISFVYNTDTEEIIQTEKTSLIP